jgi:hypothetical protein
MDETTVDGDRVVATDEDLDNMFSHPTEVVSNEPETPQHRAGGRWAMVGLVAAGAAVGAIAVSQLHGHSAATTTSVTAPAGTIGGQLPNGGPGGPGGLDGEQHLSGTVTAVGSSTVTVQTSSGTTTYVITSSTEIVRNEQTVSLSAIKSGDAAFMHVYPANGKMAVERLFAGTSATAGNNSSGGPPPGTTT